ncbi:MAG: winged helix-turn-helix transcriptional regulator [Verrucomicrobia bacterium]|nr:MAG: winged helix-turn-helix transcriptional regulator [Verrucomicrobiota bacterium]
MRWLRKGVRGVLETRRRKSKLLTRRQGAGLIRSWIPWRAHRILRARMPTPRPSPPPKRLPVLLRRAWFGLNQSFRQRTAHLGITPDQFSILRWLSEGDPQGMTQRALTDLMASDANTITSTLSRMEKADLIARQLHETDRRARRVKLQPAGRRALTRGRKIALELQEQVLAALPAARREKFLEDLEAIASACVGER